MFEVDEIECTETEVEPRKLKLTGLPLPTEEEREHFGGKYLWVPAITVSGYDLVYYTVDITYQDKKGNVTERRVTIDGYYADIDAIEVHCHLKNERRRLFVSGISKMKFVSNEYIDNPGFVSPEHVFE